MPVANIQWHGGHAFASSFESEGEPRELALDEATGQLHVVDRGSERVQIFEAEPSGQYKASGGLKVRSPGAIAVDDYEDPADPSRLCLCRWRGRKKRLPR